MNGQTSSPAKVGVTPPPLYALPLNGVLQRKCACGSGTAHLTGECAECRSKKHLQTKLVIGTSNDPLEREADRIADQVMATPASSAVSGAPLHIQRYAGRADEGTDTAPASVDSVLASSGRPLEPALRQDMEQRFGHDFSKVRIHTDGPAEQSALDVNANAYTVGHNIVFGAGQFAPGMHEGRRLIAHELTHVMQQSNTPTQSSPPFTSVVDPYEMPARGSPSMVGSPATNKRVPLATMPFQLARAPKSPSTPLPPSDPHKVEEHMTRVINGVDTSTKRSLIGDPEGGSTGFKTLVIAELTHIDSSGKVIGIEDRYATNDNWSNPSLRRVTASLGLYQVDEVIAAKGLRLHGESIVLPSTGPRIILTALAVSRNVCVWCNLELIDYAKSTGLVISGYKRGYISVAQFRPKLTPPTAEGGAGVKPPPTAVGQLKSVSPSVLKKLIIGTATAAMALSEPSEAKAADKAATTWVSTTQPSKGSVADRQKSTTPAVTSVRPPSAQLGSGEAQSTELGAGAVETKLPATTATGSTRGPAQTKTPDVAAPPKPLMGSQGQRVYGGSPNYRDPINPPGQQQRAGAAVVMLNLTRARLEDISDDDERDKAQTWIVRNRPVIYQELFESPGSAMVVKFHFERKEGRLRYNGVTKDMRPDGTPPTQGESPQVADIFGTGVTLFFPPVRKRPQTAPSVPSQAQLPALQREPPIDSAERLISLMPNSANYIETYYTLKALVDTQGPMGPHQLRLGDKDLSATAMAVDQALRASKQFAESKLLERMKNLQDQIAQIQKNLESALTAHGNFVTKWWYRKRIALLDPHVLDKPREHASAAADAIRRADFRAATESLKAGRDLVDYADASIRQFWTGIDVVEEQEL